MSDFLGRVGHIAEWAVVSNLANRAVNAGCDKAGDLWRNRKHNKHKTPDAAPTPPQSHSPAPFPPYQPQQASYMPPAPPASGGQLLINVNHMEGLNQWGPLTIVLECNQQRSQTALGQFQQQLAFPVYQFDYDQLFIWIQTEYQNQTIAHGEIPVRVLLNNNPSWAPAQQRWIPLRDQYNGPCGQLLVTIEYRSNYPPPQPMPGPPPPPYSYY